ncbi:hypothetical protein Dda_7084 [Drechslerella dactyloides]|uniref:Uncharacterized protein n=1 Tax=Drechslerella dactyloides TaxID=74499 RepID=A0AAD6ITM8_DREDA|nr:hypothetical protein Dda_7084 [Drechslerella dactyloides]
MAFVSRSLGWSGTRGGRSGQIALRSLLPPIASYVFGTKFETYIKQHVGPKQNRKDDWGTPDATQTTSPDGKLDQSQASKGSRKNRVPLSHKDIILPPAFRHIQFVGFTPKKMEVLNPSKPASEFEHGIHELEENMYLVLYTLDMCIPDKLGDEDIEVVDSDHESASADELELDDDIFVIRER